MFFERTRPFRKFNVHFLFFHSPCDQNMSQNGTVGVRAHLYDYQTALKIWKLDSESNCKFARAPTLRAKSVFLVIVEILHENVDF